MFLSKIFAYIKKSLSVQLSYRFAFFLSIVETAASLLTFYFIDKLFGFQIAPHLAQYGVNYFSYALVSIAFAGFIGSTFWTISGQISLEQAAGTLEALLVTPTKPETLIISMAIWNLLYASIEFIIYIILGIFLFHIDFSNANILSVIVITILSIISFNSIGVISASFIIVLKKGDPISWLVNMGIELLGGVYFPVTVLPKWLQYISYLFPVTYVVNSVELAVHKGASLYMLFPDILVLLILSLILPFVGFFSLKFAMNKARMAGNLVQY